MRGKRIIKTPFEDPSDSGRFCCIFKGATLHILHTYKDTGIFLTQIMKNGFYKVDCRGWWKSVASWILIHRVNSCTYQDSYICIYWCLKSTHDAMVWRQIFSAYNAHYFHIWSIKQENHIDDCISWNFWVIKWTKAKYDILVCCVGLVCYYQVLVQWIQKPGVLCQWSHNLLNTCITFGFHI